MTEIAALLLDDKGVLVSSTTVPPASQGRIVVEFPPVDHSCTIVKVIVQGKTWSMWPFRNRHLDEGDRFIFTIETA